MDRIRSYFPELSQTQLDRLGRLEDLYRTWNERINVISRKDIGSLYLHHVLHSLSIARFIGFSPGTRILDAGTGGGFPGIPLAILFPLCRFTLADSIAKKIRVAEAIALDLDLENVEAKWTRVEEMSDSFDFVVCRAVTRFTELISWVGHLVRPGGINPLPNGIICLKGGEIDDEVRSYGSRISVTPVSSYFSEEYFATKKIIYLPAG